MDEAVSVDMMRRVARSAVSDHAGSKAALSLQGKVVLITGATSPIGRQLVDAFSSAGARLALCVRRVQDVDPLERSLLSREISYLAIPCDLRYEEDVVRMIHRIVRRFGRIDAVVNTASVCGPKLPIVNYPVDSWRNILATNLTGSYLVSREVLPWMDRQGSGSIIHVTSSLTESSRPEWGAYYVSTHAVEGLTRLLATEHRNSGVRVNCVDIGAPKPDGPAPTDPEWTQAFLWLASDESANISGQRINLAGFKVPASGASSVTN